MSDVLIKKLASALSKARKLATVELSLASSLVGTTILATVEIEEGVTHEELATQLWDHAQQDADTRGASTQYEVLFKDAANRILSRFPFAIAVEQREGGPAPMNEQNALLLVCTQLAQANRVQGDQLIKMAAQMASAVGAISDGTAKALALLASENAKARGAMVDEAAARVVQAEIHAEQKFREDILEKGFFAVSLIADKLGVQLPASESSPPPTNGAGSGTAGGSQGAQ